MILGTASILELINGMCQASCMCGFMTYDFHPATFNDKGKLILLDWLNETSLGRHIRPTLQILRSNHKPLRVLPGAKCPFGTATRLWAILHVAI